MLLSAETFFYIKPQTDDEELSQILKRHPELRSVLGKLDPEEEPARYAAFLARLVEKALQLENDPATRLRICNQIVEQIADSPTSAFLRRNRLLSANKPVLLEVTPPYYAAGAMPRPETSLLESSLFTGSPTDPQLVNELAREMRSADEVDLLVLFIKWSGLRLLMPAFEESLCARWLSKGRFVSRFCKLVEKCLSMSRSIYTLR